MFYISNIEGKLVHIIEVDDLYYDINTHQEISKPANIEEMPLRLQDTYKAIDINSFKTVVKQPQIEEETDI